MRVRDSPEPVFRAPSYWRVGLRGYTRRVSDLRATFADIEYVEGYRSWQARGEVIK